MLFLTKNGIFNVFCVIFLYIYMLIKLAGLPPAKLILLEPCFLKFVLYTSQLLLSDGLAKYMYYIKIKVFNFFSFFVISWLFFPMQVTWKSWKHVDGSSNRNDEQSKDERFSYGHDLMVAV